jgi:hypothetical protein
MPLEYHTAQFSTDQEGLNQRNAYLAQMSANGWHVVSEVIEPGHIKGGEGCCLASICLPMGFLAPRTDNIINMTFGREVKAAAGYCTKCGKSLTGNNFCTHCGAKIDKAGV